MILRNEVITLSPGLYALSHPKVGGAPFCVSRVADLDGDAGGVESLTMPGTLDCLLRGPGDCIVWRVTDRPARILLTAFLQCDDEEVPAVRIQRLDGDDSMLPPLLNSAQDDSDGGPIAVAPEGVSIIAYVDGRGDMVASEGVCLGSPESLSSITGFQLEWPDKPLGVDIAYSVLLEGHGYLPEVNTGNFCGVRELGMRITAVRLDLVGERAGNYRLMGEAFFSGGFKACTEGGVMSGPSGFEHLAALRLEVGACDL